MIGFLKKLFFGFAPKPAGPPKRIAVLDRNSISLISNQAQWRDGLLSVEVTGEENVKICEIDLKNEEQCLLGLRFQMSSHDVAKSVYPEIWVRVDGFGECFSKGLHHKLKGTNDWVSCELPFMLKAGQRASLLRLNLVFADSGTVHLKDIELYATPLEA